MTTVSAKVEPEVKGEFIKRDGAEGKNVNQVLTEFINQYIGRPSPPVNAVVSDEIDDMLNNPGKREHLKRVVGDLLNEITATRKNAIVLERRAHPQPEVEKAEFPEEEKQIDLEDLIEELAEKPETAKCPDCGELNERKANVQYCSGCGATIEWEEEPAKEGEGWKKALIALAGGGAILYVLLKLWGAQGRRY